MSNYKKEMRMTKLTLENVEADDYPDLRQQMVEELTEVELDQSHGNLMDLLETLVMAMFDEMEDENLQAHHDIIFRKDLEGNL